MNSYDRAKLTRPLSKMERLILYNAGEEYEFINKRNELPHLDSLMNFVMLCRYSEFNNLNHFWKQYRLLSELLADTSKYYIHTPIPKKNGKGYRHIYKVDSELAFYQRNIKLYILDHLDAEYTSTYAFAYKEGVSVCDNAREHAGHDYLVKMDIADFFDNTRQSKVYGVFSKYTPYNKEVKSFLTKLVCLNGHLSQGACTSPQLANLVLVDFDLTVSDYCKALGITYTRYCDDMTFSSDKPFDSQALIDFVSNQLRLNHYKPNYRKTRVFGKGSRHVVTGIVVNNDTLRVPSEYKHELRQALYYIKKYGVTSHLAHKDIPGFGSVFSSPDKRHEESYLNMLIGRASFACRVNPEDQELRAIKRELWKYLDKYSSEFPQLCLRYVCYAEKLSQNHILNRQESCISLKVRKSFYDYEGFSVVASFKPKKNSSKLAYRHIKYLLAVNSYPVLMAHQLKVSDDLSISFKIPVYEYAFVEQILNNCLDELLTIYSKLKLDGFLSA